MEPYFLGVDVGSTKTHALVADQDGEALGFGEAGAGNHEVAGYDGLAEALETAVQGALRAAGLSKTELAAAGFGVSGYDWPSERESMLQAISRLGLTAPVELVNDAILGLLTGSESGWGIAIVSGTGCNCRGWDEERKQEGMVTGAGLQMGEAAGAAELVQKAVRALSHEWSSRGPATALTPTFLEYTGARNPTDLLEGLINERYQLDASAAPLIIKAAQAGDHVAIDLLTWAGSELGELGKAVIRQLGFEALEFDLVLVGSMFLGGALIIEPLKESIFTLAPRARFRRLEAPPVVGAVLLGMDLIGKRTPGARRRLIAYFDSC